MSRNNQKRRADKKRLAAQQRRAAQHQSHSGERIDNLDDAALDQRLVRAAASDLGASAHREVLTGFISHQAGPSDDPATLRRMMQRIDVLIKRHLALMLDNGWQPADVAHVIRRDHTQRTQRLAVAHLAVHARATGAADRAPLLWLGQLDDLGVFDPARGVIIGGHGDPLSTWSKAERLHEHDAIAGGLQLLKTTILASKLSRLVDPPSAWGATNRGVFPTPVVPTGDVDAKALKLIRALLAKAEATNFDAEAETFSAKAQELMTRHSIDAAVLAAATHGSSARFGVESRRVHIDNPYGDEKAVLLSVIANVNGVRSVWSPHVGFCTVVGTPVDLQLTDLLFTSLLVQATRASAEATSRDRRSSTPSFRRAFLTAYADCIGERLEAAQHRVATEAEQHYGSSLVPILADRDAAVDAAFTEAFPETVPMRNRRLDAEGWYAGRSAADRADIGAGAAITRG